MFITILFLCIEVNAQEGSSAKEEGGGRGFFIIGGSWINLNDLNSKLESKGYSKLSENLISLGSGGYGRIGRFIIGGEGHALAGKDVISGDYKTSIGIGYGFFDIGYLIYTNGGLNIYPMLGIGGGGLGLKIFENKTATFDDVLNNPKRSSELSISGFLFNVAVGIDYLLKLGEDERGKGGLVFGIRGGYVFALSKGDWKLDELGATGVPQIGITGPFIQLIFGGGGTGTE